MKKFLVILPAIILLTMMLAGCGGEYATENFPAVKILKVEKTQPTPISTVRYTVYFTNGMKKQDIIDENILDLETNRTMDITFYKATTGEDWKIKTFRYLEEQ